MSKLRILGWLSALILPFYFVQAQEPHWNYDPYAYQYDMSVYCTLQLHNNHQVTATADYEIAAFCGDECRGIAVLDTTTIKNEAYYYLRIRSNLPEGEQITFRCYNHITQKEVELSNQLSFQELSAVGLPSDLFVLQEKVYQVRADGNFGGQVAGGGTFVRGDSVSLSATAENGYHFVEWSNGLKDNPYHFVVTEDFALSAIFAPNRYVVAYMIDDQIWYSDTVAYGDTIRVPSYPEKEGYTFSGWIDLPVKMPSHNLNVTGYFSVNVYTITYLIDGEVYQIVECPYGEVIVPLEEPDIPGKIFSGWQDVPELMPAHDLVITGSFVTTGIGAVRDEMKTADVYTIDGILVRSKMNIRDIKKLPKGKYIIGGKKRIIN